jgi:hypothetical protein
VEQERVTVPLRAAEVPLPVPRELLSLLVDGDLVVVRHGHGGRGVPPRRRLLLVDLEAAGVVLESAGGVGRTAQVPLRHEVGVDVVVAERAVLVGARHAIDVEPAEPVVVPERTPQPGRLDQQLEPDLPGELLVAGSVDVPQRGVGDVGSDVERGGAGRPVTGALLAADRTPRKGRTTEPEVAGTVPRGVQGGMPPPQGVARRRGLSVGQHRQHEHLHLPEDVPVVPRSG